MNLEKIIRKVPRRLIDIALISSLTACSLPLKPNPSPTMVMPTNTVSIPKPVNTPRPTRTPGPSPTPNPWAPSNIFTFEGFYDLENSFMHVLVAPKDWYELKDEFETQEQWGQRMQQQFEDYLIIVNNYYPEFEKRIFRISLPHTRYGYSGEILPYDTERQTMDMELVNNLLNSVYLHEYLVWVTDLEGVEFEDHPRYIGNMDIIKLRAEVSPEEGRAIRDAELNIIEFWVYFQLDFPKDFRLYLTWSRGVYDTEVMHGRPAHFDEGADPTVYGNILRIVLNTKDGNHLYTWGLESTIGSESK